MRAGRIEPPVEIGGDCLRMSLADQSIARPYQRTLKNAIDCCGTGLHSGKKVSMRLCPGAPDSGIVFRRTDIANGGAIIPARWENVVDTRLNTMIGNEYGVRVGTIEHLMAALCGSGIDNAVVEIDGPEVPVMDGSAAPFMFLVECAGIVEQKESRQVVEILKPIAVGDDSRWASLRPGPTFSVSFEIDFDTPLIDHQTMTVDLSNGAFRSEISRARTFGFEHEVAEMRSHGLALGGSLDNAVVISGDGVLNDDGLRYHDEFVRHKILDCVGDLYLGGTQIIGHFHGRRSGHSLNNRLLEKLFTDGAAWRLVDASSLTAAHPSWGEDRLAANG